MTFGYQESAQDRTEAGTERRKPPRLHLVPNAFTGLPVQVALCGFLITPANRTTTSGKAGDELIKCERCEVAHLELLWALSEYGSEADQ